MPTEFTLPNGAYKQSQVWVAAKSRAEVYVPDAVWRDSSDFSFRVLTV